MKINIPITDEAIIDQILAGDVDSFEMLVSRYQNYIFSIGKRFFWNNDDASDFTQEVFIKAYQKLDTFKRKTPFRYWLMRIAYNHGINSIKKNKESSDIDDEVIPALAPTPGDSLETEEIKRLLNNAVGELPEKYRICVDLFFFMGLGYNEISNITDIPVNTIKSNVFRAKKILRDNLSGTMAEAFYEID